MAASPSDAHVQSLIAPQWSAVKDAGWKNGTLPELPPQIEQHREDGHVQLGRVDERANRRQAEPTHAT